MKSFRLQLILPVFLTAVTPAIHAAPQTPANASAAVKPQILQPDSPLVKAQFARIAKAYGSLGSFWVTGTDTTGMGKDIERIKYRAYYGTDGHLGLKVMPPDGSGQSKSNVYVQLYDGKEIIASMNGHAEQRTDVKSLETDPGQVTEFFSNTTGAMFVGVLAKYDRDPEGYQLFGTYSVQDLRRARRASKTSPTSARARRWAARRPTS